ncbi:hypothetical protein P3L10_010953 [Capsicum annuum]
MEMWPVSSNIIVAPPEISTLPGRPSKSRRKESGKTKKSRKLPRTRLVMTCSLCHDRGHNKRGCPLRGQSAEPSAAPSATPTGSVRGRGIPKKTPPETPNTPPQGSVGSGRERARPKKTPSEIISACQQEKKEKGDQKRQHQ